MLEGGYMLCFSGDLTESKRLTSDAEKSGGMDVEAGTVERYVGREDTRRWGTDDTNRQAKS